MCAGCGQCQTRDTNLRLETQMRWRRDGVLHARECKRHDARLHHARLQWRAHVCTRAVVRDRTSVQERQLRARRGLFEPIYVPAAGLECRPAASSTRRRLISARTRAVSMSQGPSLCCHRVAAADAARTMASLFVVCKCVFERLRAFCRTGGTRREASVHDLVRVISAWGAVGGKRVEIVRRTTRFFEHVVCRLNVRTVLAKRVCHTRTSRKVHL